MRWLAPLGGLGMLVALLGLGQPARAQSPVVVEFFTSQGCSTCPPADEIFARLSRQPGVVALALHVDYWDYLGWKDVFGRPEHTERQRAYAKAHGERTIYTPQMIVQGADIVIGHQEGAIGARIAAHAAQPGRVLLEARRAGGGIEISIAPAAGPVGAADVHLVEYAPERAMTIESGENAGYHHVFANVVTRWLTVAQWEGDAPVTIRHDGGGEHVAVLVQALRHGPILSAARLP